MGRACGLLAHGAQLGALSGTDARPPLKRASAIEKAVAVPRRWPLCIYPLFTGCEQNSRTLDTSL
jgi:hypothetical protein